MEKELPKDIFVDRQHLIEQTKTVYNTQLTPLCTVFFFIFLQKENIRKPVLLSPRNQHKKK
jgi:hypothetical protein